MRLNLPKYLLLSFVWLVTIPVSQAQFSVSMYLDAGKNNVSEGLYVKTAAIGEYKFGKNRAGGGVQFDVRSPGTNFLSAASLNIGREVSIKNFPFEIEGLFHYSSFSEFFLSRR